MAEENYWNVAGNVLLGGLAGVGVIALSPLFGSALVITGAGAAVGSLVGGGLGAGWAYLNDEEEAKAQAVAAAKEAGRNEAKAEYASIVEALKSRVNLHTLHTQQQNGFDDLTLAMYGIGLASLSHCRATDPRYRQDLKEFVFGSAHSHLPAAMLDDIAQVEASCPTLAGTFARAHKVAPDAHALFAQMVDVAAMLVDADDKHRLRGIWSQLRAA